jgi:hypothetical protein
MLQAAFSLQIELTSIGDENRLNVAFNSQATNLVAGDTDATSDSYVKDMVTGTISIVGVSSKGY